MPDDPVYGFDRATGEAVIRLMREQRRGSRFGDEEPLGPAVHVYIAKAPAGGIAAMTGTTPGSASCTLYTITGAPALAVTSPAQTVTVYNIGLSAVPANAYITVKREILSGKFIYQNIEASANYKPLVRFTLAAALATTDSSKTATISLQIGPGTASPNTGAGAITVHNLPVAAGGYLFEGDSGDYGIAGWDSGANYHILNMECPT